MNKRDGLRLSACLLLGLTVAGLAALTRPPRYGSAVSLPPGWRGLPLQAEPLPGLSGLEPSMYGTSPDEFQESWAESLSPPTRHELADGRVVSFDQDEGIVVQSAGVGVALSGPLASPPAVAPDRRRFAYIEPWEWERVGQAYLYDVTTGTATPIVKSTDLRQGYTPKKLRWLDNRYLLVLIGYGYGTMTTGGNFYLFDTSTSKLTPFIVVAAQGQEISDFDLRFDPQTISLSVYESDGWRKVRSHRFTRDDLVAAARAGRKLTL